ncbi:MAG: hypothetical protein M1832_003305 [Thelocarpon impressellum]|nr:MAG: hypothetical protein M1832_003305 [Thelocarpon impressellum]
MEKAEISNWVQQQYVIGLGPQKFDMTGEPRMYMDAVLCDVGQLWLTNQWTPDSVVVECVPETCA